MHWPRAAPRPPPGRPPPGGVPPPSRSSPAKRHAGEGLLPQRTRPTTTAPPHRPEVLGRLSLPPPPRGRRSRRPRPPPPVVVGPAHPARRAVGGPPEAQELLGDATPVTSL